VRECGAVSNNVKGKRPTSRDVARLASVSHTTVSFVVNNVPTASISEETRARVHAAIAQLDYHPHEAARNLGRQASRVITVAVPEAHNAHHQETVAGVEEYARERGYSIVRAITNFDHDEERRCLGWLKQRRTDGLILSITPGRALEDEIRALSARGHVITRLGTHDAMVDSVMVEEAAGECQVLDHLIGLGHRRIGYIYGVADHDALRGRLEMCLSCQREHGLPVVDEWVRRCGPTLAEGYGATRALLAACQGATHPSALVVVNDLLASAVLSALFAEGVAVPADMSVVSFDNTPLAAYMIPPLTSVDCEARSMGARAARLTIERLDAPQPLPVHLETRARLIARQSSGPAPS